MILQKKAKCWHRFKANYSEATKEFINNFYGDVFVEAYEKQMKILLSKGDVILLAKGTHSIEMISDCEILEVKQGPFIGAEDKTILESVE
jgi:hypothetical protein